MASRATAAHVHLWQYHRKTNTVQHRVASCAAAREPKTRFQILPFCVKERHVHQHVHPMDVPCHSLLPLTGGTCSDFNVAHVLQDA